MNNRRGFTLVELLVVIAIIALLMSILMPTLSRTRRQAKAIICQSNLRQWAIIFEMYLSEYDGSFPSGAYMLWTEAARPYYADPDLCCCPSAKKRWRDGGQGIFAAWDVGAPLAPDAVKGWTGDRPGDYGSYGLNEWLYNPPPEFEVLWGSLTTHNWRHCNVKGAANIPMFVDCWWLGGGPIHQDAPPEFERLIVYEDAMDTRRFCLNRHNGAVNGCFLDLSVRKIELKCLWKFKWNRMYNITYPPPKWPQWMKKLEKCK